MEKPLWIKTELQYNLLQEALENLEVILAAQASETLAAQTELEAIRDLLQRLPTVE